jgi:hypothetical protein
MRNTARLFVEKTTTKCLSALLLPAALSIHLCPACLLVLHVVPCSWTCWSVEAPALECWASVSLF